MANDNLVFYKQVASLLFTEIRLGFFILPTNKHMRILTTYKFQISLIFRPCLKQLTLKIKIVKDLKFRLTGKQGIEDYDGNTT